MSQKYVAANSLATAIGTIAVTGDMIEKHGR